MVRNACVDGRAHRLRRDDDGDGDVQGWFFHCGRYVSDESGLHDCGRHGSGRDVHDRKLSCRQD